MTSKQNTLKSNQNKKNKKYPIWKLKFENRNSEKIFRNCKIVTFLTNKYLKIHITFRVTVTQCYQTVPGNGPNWPKMVLD